MSPRSRRQAEAGTGDWIAVAAPEAEVDGGTRAEEVREQRHEPRDRKVSPDPLRGTDRYRLATPFTFQL